MVKNVHGKARLANSYGEVVVFVTIHKAIWNNFLYVIVTVSRPSDVEALKKILFNSFICDALRDLVPFVQF